MQENSSKQPCEIILDSIIDGVRITTIRYEIWRPLHAELMTYRRCARNAASSRAVPFEMNYKRVMTDPFVPKWIGKTHKGMQPDSFLEGKEYEEFALAWTNSAHATALAAYELYSKGVAKSTLNRMLEPYNTINVLMTGSETHWDHVFRQRCSREMGGQGDAERNLQDLVDSIKRAYTESVPEAREMHLPYAGGIDALPVQAAAMASAARCARLSYTPFGGPKSDVSADIELAKRLLADGHLSPFEHLIFAYDWALVSVAPTAGTDNAVSRYSYTFRELIEAGCFH
jgi:thymidylate synthase ThyX